jgi:kynureninase
MADPIAESLLEYRKHFPALEECVHFISHSLGCVPAKAADDLAEFADLWRTKSITAWGDWLPEVDRAAARIAKIISAPAGTVIMHQNVSTVMSVLASCVDFTEKRNKVVYESLMFPTVSYVWQAEKRRGADCVVVPAKGNLVDADAICAAIDERTLFVPIQHVVFATGQIQDVKKIVARANEVGAHVILDAYQSIGAVPPGSTCARI